jgi:hypothetical protein
MDAKMGLHPVQSARRLWPDWFIGFSPEVEGSIRVAESAAGATEAFFVSILLPDIKTG